MNEQEAAAALMAAMAKAQGEFLPIEKNREVEITTKAGYKYKFRYADLEEIISKTRPALSANGLAMIQTVEHGQNGPLLSCKLMHSGGGIITSECLIPSARDMAADPKTFGAAISYFRRYMVTAMLGVAADDDLDADGQEPGKQEGSKQKATFDSVAAVAEVQKAATLDALQTVWQKRGAEAVDAKDKTGHAALKEAVKTRKAELEKATATDVKVKPEEGVAA